MKRQLIGITLFFILCITVTVLFLNTHITSLIHEDSYREQLVDLNEIIKLSNDTDAENEKKLEQAVLKFKEKLGSLQKENGNAGERKDLWLMYGICIGFLLLVFAYVYHTVLRPFDKLQHYADELSKGNFDCDLKYERTNYFGKFTWAFDHMRREITKARACEKEAIENNKTVIASLSHDIKTPIASIRAYAEGLDANLAAGPEARRKYCSVIMRKCDEVTELTEDLFLHSLSDLNKLKIVTQRINLREVLTALLSQLSEQDSHIRLTQEIPEVTVMLDIKRFEQVLENLMNNAKKYAPDSQVDIGAGLSEEQIIITVQDYGPGIADEDMPFVFDKFYRGKNAGDRQGAGLGLYIVKYIMEQMDGSAALQNGRPGLTVTLKLPWIS